MPNPVFPLSSELQHSDSVQFDILLLDIRPQDLKVKFSNVDLRYNYSSSPRKASSSLRWTCTKMKQRLVSKTKLLPWQFQKRPGNQHTEKVTAVRRAPYLACDGSQAQDAYCWAHSGKWNASVHSMFRGKYSKQQDNYASLWWKIRNPGDSPFRNTFSSFGLF